MNQSTLIALIGIVISLIGLGAALFEIRRATAINKRVTIALAKADDVYEKVTIASGKANEEYEKANTEYTKAIEHNEKALRLSEDFERLLREYKGRILDWENLVENLAEAIHNEPDSIMMALDTLAYGKVSVPHAHQRFWEALLSTSVRKTSMEIITFNERARREASNAQHGAEFVDTPAGTINPIKEHFDHLESLKKEGGNTVKIILTDFFPLHLFIFTGSKVAIFAIQEIDSDRTVKSYAIKTQDDGLIQICKRIFVEMQRNSELG